MSALLTVKDLKVSFNTEDGVVHAVEGVSYEVEPGKTLGIVGESGSGKTVGTLTIMGLTRAANTQISGQAIFDGGTRSANLERNRGRYDELLATYGTARELSLDGDLLMLDTASVLDQTSREDRILLFE